MMQSYWFGDAENGRCHPCSGDAAGLADRLLSLHTSMDRFVPPDWTMARDCGFCRDRAGYLAKLRDVCVVIAKRRIREKYRQKDTELLQMVRTLDELDTVINLLSGHVVEWYQIRQPSFSRKYRRTPARSLVRTVGQRSGGALGRVVGDVERLSETRTMLARDVSGRAYEVMPNCSALIGGLVAARLLLHAGGLGPLARLPGSAIQVLGARTALFSHLRAGTPSPKHGIIFQHRRVHNAPRQVRGRVARVLAAQLAIAARVDLYRGVVAPEFIEQAQARIDAAGRVP
jgi:nucleolar protein 56